MDGSEFDEWDIDVWIEIPFVTSSVTVSRIRDMLIAKKRWYNVKSVNWKLDWTVILLFVFSISYFSTLVERIDGEWVDKIKWTKKEVKNSMRIEKSWTLLLESTRKMPVCWEEVWNFTSWDGSFEVRSIFIFKWCCQWNKLLNYLAIKLQILSIIKT